MICICNDRSSAKLEGLGRLAINLPFSPPDELDVLRRLNAICKAEGLTLGRSQYFALARQARGDLRAAVNALHFLAGAAGQPGEKDARTPDGASAARDLLRPSVGVERKIDDFFVDYDTVPEYVHDGLLFNDDCDAWATAMDSMAAGDEVSRTVHEMTSFELLPAYGVCSSVLPAVFVPQNRVMAARFPEAFATKAKLNKNARCLGEVAMKCSRNCVVPRAAFRDGAAELLVFRCYDMLAEAMEKELVAFMGGMEITKDDMVDLREVVDFGLKTFPDVKAGASFTRLFNASHSQSPKNADSLDSQRVDYFILGNQPSKKGTGRSKQ